MFCFWTTNVFPPKDLEFLLIVVDIFEEKTLVLYKMVYGKSWHTLAHIKVEYEYHHVRKRVIKCATFHPCRALFTLRCEDALRFFHYCFPTHIWVSTAQQQHWCWSFSWLRWRALPTPEKVS